MRAKQARLVVSFHTTNEAMAMQQAARSDRLKGRLVPIPRQLSAGCGLAWSEPAANEMALQRTIENHGLEYEHITALDL